jgi:protein SCO1/2
MTEEQAPESTPSGGVPELALWGLLVTAILILVLFAALRGAPSTEPAAPLPVIAEVPAFELVGRGGEVITAEHFRGEPWVADFIFTRCVAVCPRMSMQMKKVVGSLGEDTSIRFVSISVDPEHDTPEVLSAYAERYEAGEDWYFLTGERAAIHRLIKEGFLLPFDPDPDPELTNGIDPIVHSNRFVLVDREGRIRATYDPFERDALERLEADARRLLAEGPSDSEG